MPNLYARSTALPNVVGRVDYISSPHRQERLLAAHDGAADLLDGRFWHVLASESQAAFEQFGAKSRNGKELKCCQGRELVIQLSNSLLERLSAEEICQIIADEFLEKEGLISAVGLHLKHFSNKPDNLHAHVVFSERQLLDKPAIKTAERNLFFDANGTRRYKKSEILDENKQLLPGCRIVKKGEIYEQRYFGNVDAKFSSKAWMKHLKTDVILPLRNGKLKGDVEITEFDASTGKLAQQHVGNAVTNMPGGAEAEARIEAYNELVKEYNRLVDAGIISHKNAMIVQKIMARSRSRNQDLMQSIQRLEEILRKALEERDELRRHGAQEETRTKQQANTLADLISRADPGSLEIEGGQRKIKTRRDWRVQAMVDSIRVAREVGAKSATELEAAKKQIGMELGRAKQAYAAAQKQFERGEIDQAQLDRLEQKYLQVKKRYKECARAVDSLQRTQHKQVELAEQKTDPGDR